MLDQQSFGDDGTQTARAKEANESRNEVDEQDNQVAHPVIVAMQPEIASPEISKRFGIRQRQVEGFLTNRFYRDYDIMSNGEEFVMIFPADPTAPQEAARPQINVVLNWHQELKERMPEP